MFKPPFSFILSDQFGGGSSLLPHRIFGFVDGGYLRKEQQNANAPLVDPRQVVEFVKNINGLSDWRRGELVRVNYYDAEPSDPQDTPTESKDYWAEIERLPDTHLGFGALKGHVRRRRQKRVDTLIAVDMLVGAFNRIYDIAVLVAGDEDYVPVVEEVKRCGCQVFLFAAEKSLSRELRRTADRVTAMEENRLSSFELKQSS